MKAIRPDAPSTAEDAVHRPRDADREPLDPTRKGVYPVGFHDQVHVILLHAEMDDPEGLVGGSSESVADGIEDAVGPQGSEAAHRSHRHMRGRAGIVPRARTVRDAGSSTRGWLATGTASAATPGRRRGEGELLLQAMRHLD